MNARRLIRAALLLPFSLAAAASPPVRVVYPRQDEGDNRDAYKIELLQMALDATVPDFGPFLLEPSASVMSERRMDALMERGDGSTLNLIFKPATRDREESMAPVRFPILKNLLGFRVLLIRADSQPAFSRVRSLDDLRSFTIGQGLGWRDVGLFAHNRVPVVEVPEYEALFAMLSGKRFDAFSRGITEAPHEFAERSDAYPNMRIETDLLLYYPWPVYFFARRTDDGRALAHRIETGLRRLVDSGEFDALFHRYHAGAFRELNLPQRRLIVLDNPFLPPDAHGDPQLPIHLLHELDAP